MATRISHQCPHTHGLEPLASAGNASGFKEAISTFRACCSVFLVEVKVRQYLFFPPVCEFDEMFISMKIVSLYLGSPSFKPFFSFFPVLSLVYKVEFTKY